MSKNYPDYNHLLSLSDNERSILIIERLWTIGDNQTNHLRHHWAITLVCAAAALSGVFNLGIAFLIIFFKVG